MGGPCNGGGGGLKRKRSFEKRFRRTKRMYINDKKDVDQIQDDIKKIKRGEYKPETIDIEKPGMGQYKCIICARYFMNETVLKSHKKTKKHKKMYVEYLILSCCLHDPFFVYLFVFFF